jgi:hypothetical protein
MAMISYPAGGGRVVLQTAFRTKPRSYILLEREQRPRLMERVPVHVNLRLKRRTMLLPLLSREDVGVLTKVLWRMLKK